MASLRKLITDNIDAITEGIEWLVFYKEGRSWNASCYFPEYGNYDTGYGFSEEDFREMKRILGR